MEFGDVAKILYGLVGHELTGVDVGYGMNGKLKVSLEYKKPYAKDKEGDLIYSRIWFQKEDGKFAATGENDVGGLQ